MLDYKKEYELEHDINRKAELTNLISRYNNIQHSRKIALNSLYGAMGTPYFRFYDIRLASAITLSGQLYIKWIMKKTNEYFNKILNTIDIDYCQYQDTDSLFLNFKPLLLKVFNGDLSNTTKIVDFLDTISDDRIAKIIDIAFKELSTYTNTEKQFIQMHREKIILSGIWKAKKRYILNVIDNEGVRYSEPKLSITGMEMVVSTTPKIIRNKMKELLHIIFNNTEKDVQNFILDFRILNFYSQQNHTINMSDSKEISAPSEVRIETAAQQPNWPTTEVVKHSNADEINGIGISKSYLKSLSGILRILIIVNKNLMYLKHI
jgi:DNA polymerase elongation subunit (family B)